MIQHKRTALLAAGQVQGVGFRPFIYRLAVEGGLSGSVGNTSDGVRIEVQGPPEQVDTFAVRLRRELPPLARLTRLEITELPPVDGHAGHSVLVSPDVGICEDCLRDMHTPGNPRFGYAFTNCTNCGPRYTITRSIPYDRATTSMACFPFCPRCEAEYRDPLDRRFHAQPVACPDCGKKINVFGESHLDEVAANLGLPVLARLPIDPKVAQAYDNGQMETVNTDLLTRVVEAIEKAE